MTKCRWLFGPIHAVSYVLIISVISSINIRAHENKQSFREGKLLLQHFFGNLVKPDIKSNCYAGLKELENRIGNSEEKLLNIVKLIKQISALISEISIRKEEKCERKGSGNYSFVPDNSVDNDNSNNISNKDVAIQSFQKTRDGKLHYSHIPYTDYTIPHYSSTSTTKNYYTINHNSTTPSPTSYTTKYKAYNYNTLSTTTTKETNVDIVAMCYDVGHIIQDWPMDEFYTVKTKIPNNTPQVCAKFCLFLEYSNSVVNNGDNCYCSNIPLEERDKTNPYYCDVPCAGDPYVYCGGREERFVTYLPTNVFTIEEAIKSHPSGLCRKVFLGYGQVDSPVKEMFEDNTPGKCKMYCTLMGYSWACAHKGKICVCESEKPDKIHESQAACDIPCPGNHRRWCGSRTDGASCFPTGY